MLLTYGKNIIKKYIWFTFERLTKKLYKKSKIKYTRVKGYTGVSNINQKKYIFPLKKLNSIQ